MIVFKEQHGSYESYPIEPFYIGRMDHLDSTSLQGTHINQPVFAAAKRSLFPPPLAIQLRFYVADAGIVLFPHRIHCLAYMAFMHLGLQACSLQRVEAGLAVDAADPRVEVEIRCLVGGE